MNGQALGPELVEELSRTHGVSLSSLLDGRSAGGGYAVRVHELGPNRLRMMSSMGAKRARSRSARSSTWRHVVNDYLAPLGVGLLVAAVLIGVALSYASWKRGVEQTVTAAQSASTDASPKPTPASTPTPPPAPSMQLDTVFMGDSITQGDTAEFESELGDLSWVKWLESEKNSPWQALANVAVGEQTTRKMADRFDKHVVDRKPEAVVILAGTYDVAQHIPLETTLANLRRMVNEAESAGAEVWLVSPPPNGQFTAEVAALVEAQRGLAEEMGVPFVDIFTAVGVDGRWPVGMTVDGVSPTIGGAQAIAEAVLAEVG